jgi:thiamine pyrophosphokinase
MSRIVIFANGVPGQPELLKTHLRATDRIFCADGGTNHALALGLIPEIIAGDLDSLSADVVTQVAQAGARIQRHPSDKDQTDLELVLELATAEGPDEIAVVTALGGRLDQTLANIFLLARSIYDSVRITLIDGSQRAIVLHDRQTVTIDGQPGDTLSLVPLTPKVDQVSLTGVKWPLAKASLAFGSTLSISNVLTTPPAKVQIGSGRVLVVHIEQRFEEK